MTELTIELEKASSSKETKKFGTFLGVYVPSILMLFGVIIFLRLGWIVGVSGLFVTLSIITIAALIALITVLSMSAIATNIEVKAGGIYYILSRSLGIKVGSAVGIPLFFKQSLSIAFCVIGFAESLKDLIPSWDITSIGLCTLAALAFLAYTSVRWAMKVQMWIFIAIIASLVSLFTGTKIEPVTPDITTSFQSLGFWSIFAIFFPAMTGVESSVSLSGDLRNPSKSLPLGTITAIITGFLLYAGIAIFLYFRVPLDRLITDPLVMQDLASIPPLIIVGIWGATLSSALGGLLAAPRTLKAIADDGMAPKLFSKTYGPTQEPRIATLVTCSIAFLGIYFGSINLIAPLLTMITLICYGILNWSAGIENLMDNPSWRPRLRIHWAVSLVGALLCFCAMLMIEVGVALLSLALVSMIYLVVKRRELSSSWYDIHQGILLYFAQSILYRLTIGNSAAKSWRPHFLVFTKFSEEHSVPLLKFSEAIGQSKGFLTTASFVPKGTLTIENQKEMQNELETHFKNHNVRSFVKIIEASSVTNGVKHMLGYYGLGPLAPNTILFGGIKKGEKSTDFVDIIHSAISKHYNVVIMSDEIKPGAFNSDIHLWWDDANPANSDFMLVIAHMLQRNHKKILVKAIVADETQKRAKHQQLLELSIQKRLSLDIEVFVSSSDLASQLHLIKEFSKNAEIVLIGLKPPCIQTENINEYIDYIQMLSESMDALPSLTLTLSSEHTPLDVILS